MPAQLHRDVKRHSRLCEKLIDQPACVPSALAQNELFAGERVGADSALFGQPVTWRGDCYELILAQPFSVDAAGFHR